MNVSEDRKNIYAKGYCVTKFFGGKEPIDTDHISVDVAIKKDAGKIKFASRYGVYIPKGFRLNQYEIVFDKQEVKDFDIQNKLIVNYKDQYFGRILYSMFDWKTGQNKNSYVSINQGTAIYFRQSKHNSLGLTVRDVNQYDYPEGQARIKKAKSKASDLKDKNIILMYEKNCSRYEESASVLYERLVDEGYDNVYFVLNKDNKALEKISEKYKKNIIYKDSDKHLEYFFASDTFISTESTEHALQLRIASKAAMDKIKDKDLKYVFLQHGVMYMVSLNSELRTGFRNNNIKVHKTVVSSEAEAKHFIELAGIERKDLYITGLAKFDKCIRNRDADKIVIMPTWRRWETNQARENIEQTKYYRMIRRIYNAVPDGLKDKVIILPHPLMAERFKNGSALDESIVIADNYDEIFRECNTFITDYSSAAYDVFYRGANVIFCWEEKDECMEHYGEGSYLLLNETNAFGEVCMDKGEIRASIERNYGKPQLQENIDKYRKIVEFHDGRNTERIIRQLKKDGII